MKREKSTAFIHHRCPIKEEEEEEKKIAFSF